MGSCAAPSAKGDDKFITTDYLQQCRLSRQNTTWRTFWPSSNNTHNRSARFAGRRIIWSHYLIQ
ncbi:hypothetical protein DFZ54_21820 [Escherichia coli]|nr:hypothetical protein [Escherichia coli]EFC9537513.1 hypothetical protein [Escherichia coli]EFD0684259.1 hypothetical protein [Escherichia coli]EFD0722660.1 hypothetical protein [Escherichia coli]EFD0779751.1 hypothetical protein [Escherichia coli]